MVQIVSDNLIAMIFAFLVVAWTKNVLHGTGQKQSQLFMVAIAVLDEIAQVIAGKVSVGLNGDCRECRGEIEMIYAKQPAVTRNFRFHWFWVELPVVFVDV